MISKDKKIKIGVNKFILSVSENGYGKRSAVEDYRITNRGGKGVKTISITPKTGELIAIKNVVDEDGLMIINKSGVMIRMKVESMRVMGRVTQGVRLINLKDSDQISSVAKVEIDQEDEISVDDNNDSTNHELIDEVSENDNLVEDLGDVSDGSEEE